MADVEAIFKQINNAVLDLQGAQYQSYDRPVRTLARLLLSPELEEANKILLSKVDLGQFLAENEKDQGGGMVGSESLSWPDDQEEILGLSLALILRFGEEPTFMIHLGHTYYYSGSKYIGDIRAVTSQLIIPFVRDYRDYVMSFGAVRPKRVMNKSNRIFVVHGRDGEAKHEVARFIERLGLEAIVLDEQPNQGQTIIEKIEEHGDVGFAVVLLTPDDEGRISGADDLEPRARQNVLLELGYFMARLTRRNVCALMKGRVEIPTDFAGVVWHALDAGGGWKQRLARELQAAGYVIDWNLVMR